MERVGASPTADSAISTETVSANTAGSYQSFCFEWMPAKEFFDLRWFFWCCHLALGLRNEFMRARQRTICRIHFILYSASLSVLIRSLHAHMEKAMAPHSSTLAWKIPWTEEPGRLQSMGSRRVGHDRATSFHFSLSCIGEGNGNQLQCSCLENPRDGGTWWAAVYGVAQSRTRLKWLSSMHIYICMYVCVHAHRCINFLLR